MDIWTKLEEINMYLRYRKHKNGESYSHTWPLTFGSKLQFISVYILVAVNISKFEEFPSMCPE